MLQFDGEDGLVPAGVLGQFVVGNDVCPNLVIRQPVEPNRRHLRYAEQLRRLNSPVAGDYLIVGINQDRVCKAERPHAFGDLPDLVFGMCARVARVRFQVCKRFVVDRKRSVVAWNRSGASRNHDHYPLL